MIFRLEFLILLLGLLILLAGAALIYDARRGDEKRLFRERRRRVRTPRHRPGEALTGGGMVFLGIALIGGEHWRYTVLVLLAGFVLLAAGIVMNRQYLKELLLFRGRARRAQGEERATRPPDDGGPRPRIR